MDIWTYAIDGVISALMLGFLTLSIWGWGHWLGARLGINAGPPIGFPLIFTQIWLGWAGVLLLLSALHLKFPLAWPVDVLVYGVGLLRGVQLARGYSLQTIFAWGKSHRWLALLGMILLLWVISAGMGVPRVYDSGLYYFSTLRWFNQDPLVPGLGNLHERLAFNQAFLVYVASLNFFPWFNHAHNIACGWLVLVTVGGFSLHGSYRQLSLPAPTVNRLSPRLVLCIQIILGLQVLVFFPLSSPTPDTASVLLQLVLYAYYLQLFCLIWTWQQLGGTVVDQVPDDLAVVETQILNLAQILLVLGATAITVKLSNLVLAGGIMLVALAAGLTMIWRRGGGGVRSAWVGLGLLPLLILSVWMIRGFILSGYLLFPTTLSLGHPDWQMPVDLVHATAVDIFNWARLPGQIWDQKISGWQWVGPWFQRVKFDLYALYGAVLLNGLAVVQRLSLPANSGRSLMPVNLYGLSLAPPLAGLIFWFTQAPDPRFAHAQFWLLFLAGLFPLVQGGWMGKPDRDWSASSSQGRNQRFRLIAAASLSSTLVLCLWMVQHDHFTTAYSTEPITVSTMGYEPLPVIELRQQTTDSGLRIYGPVGRDQCWDAPLPCTPYFRAGLHLRQGSLAGGFALEQ